MDHKKERFGVGMKVQKLDASRRQLETSIALFFNSGDPVSTHTLATASLQILQDLNEIRGLPSTLTNFESIKPEHRSAIKREFRKAQNFFKHADNDPDQCLDFNPEATALYIFEAIELYIQLTGERTAFMRVFSLWFRVSWPEVFIFTKEEEEQLSAVSRVLSLHDKTKFFSVLLPIYAKAPTPISR